MNREQFSTWDLSQFKTSITVGKSLVLSSGSLLVSEHDTFSIKIHGKEGRDLIFKFEFKIDENRKKGNGLLQEDYENNIKKDENGEEYLSFTFINMRNINWLGNIDKIPIAHIGGYPISLKFRIQAIGRDEEMSYIFIYTLFVDYSMDDIRK